MRTHLLGRTGTVVAALSVVFCTTADAQSDFKHGIVYYVPGNPSIRAVVAERYDMGLIENHYGADAAGVKALNPDFRWFVYNSGTDNYVLPDDDEHEVLTALAAQKGWDIEDAFLHYAVDTRVTLEGTEILVPGWPQGSATSKSQARIPVYYHDGSRRLLNFSTFRGRQLNKEAVIALAFDRPFTNTNLYADGVFLDNSSYVPYNFGDNIQGGLVLEAPGNPKIGSYEFNQFFWDQNFAPFLTALHDTLATSAQWTRDSRHKEVMINIGNSWIDEYTTRNVADVLCMEFQYSPVRNFGADMVLEAFRRDRLAAQAGMETLYLSLVATEVGSWPGTYTYDEALIGCVAWWLTSRVPDVTALFLIGTFNPSASDWEQTTWRGIIDVAEANLGLPIGDPYIMAQGTDPVGRPYAVTARRYAGGYSVVRNRGDWNQSLTPETAVSVALPQALYRLDVNGASGNAVTSISLRNGEGAVFLNSGSGEVIDPEDPPPTTVTTLGPTFTCQLTSPVEEATGVPRGAEVRFRLSDPIRSGPIPLGWITVIGSQSGPREGTLRVEQDRRLLIFTPSAPWNAGETVSVTLSPYVQRTDSLYLDGNGDGVGSGSAADAIQLTFHVAP